MSFPVRAPLAVAALALLAACGSEAPSREAPGIAGQFVATAAAEPAAEVAAPAEYRLAMGKVGAWIDAQRNLALVTFANPTLRAEGPAGESVDAAAARLDASPELAGAVREAGLSTREYATIGWSVAQAEAARAAVARGATPDAAAATAGIHPENVAFLATHGADVERMKKAMQDEINEGEVFPGLPSEEISDEN
ncbi:MAG TPA: hypothetical protein VF625_05140 [Longimicrobium sp.]